MSPFIQFCLTIATLVIITAILWIRMGRFETYLHDLQGIKTLNERLESLVGGLEGLETRRVEEQLIGIRGVLEEVRDSLERNSRGLDAAGAQAPKACLHDLVEAKLYNLGYQEISVITDLTNQNTVDPLRVVVEARKEGALHKGHLILHGNAIVELDLKPVFTSFP